MRRFAVAAIALLAAAPLAAQTQVNWDSLGAETQRVLAAYLQINTTNPPGNELETARFLVKLLADNGIESQILDTAELGAGRANVYARLRGNGSKKAIALVSHMDVVPVTPAFWSVDAFGGVVKDGFLYGRGALDMKGEGIAALMGMLAIKRSGVPLNRDIVVIGNADEELGGTGAATFVARHAGVLKDVEFLITEGGANPLDHGRLLYYGVSVSEKRTFWQRLTVHGIPSHGSRPTKNNPVPRLVAALDRIAHHETPLRVTPGVRKYLHDLSTQFAGVQAAWLANIDSSLKVP
ncbi:MAG TPA: M20/M25/M40 family metallo-hydrolase, partial [Gemmatimonadales bacterium]|nr:M20/M25/M40 family metallo-hydrolase [Gemmatimonadales bacterium]